MNNQSLNSHALPADKGSGPLLSPQFKKDYEAYLLAMDIWQEAIKKLKAMAAELSHMKNVMYGAVEIMSLFQEVEGGQMRVLSSVDNMDSDIRSQISEAQGDMNKITSGADGNNNPIVRQKPTEKQIEDAKNLVNLIHQIQQEVDLIKSNKKLGGADIAKNLQQAIDSIKGVFAGDKKSPNAWGDPKEMAGKILHWVNVSKGGGSYSPQLKDLQFGFQQMTQTTSALSTTTNTNLQFTADMFKQFLGTEQSAMEAYQKGNAQMVQNQKSS